MTTYIYNPFYYLFSFNSSKMVNELSYGIEREYVEGLESFLQASNEDEADINAIVAQMPNYSPDFYQRVIKRDNMRILDVGSGNGAKAIRLGRWFLSKGCRVRIDSIEPKEEQRKKLLQNYSMNQDIFGRVYPLTFNQIPLGRDFDLVLFIHSLYEFPRNRDGTIDGLGKLREVTKDDGVGVIVTEHKDGDFRKIKNKLYPCFGLDEPVNEMVIERTLEACKLRYRKGEKVEFKFDLGQQIDSDYGLGKSLGFLFSDSLEGRSFSKEEYIKIGEIVRKNLRRNGNDYHLNTEDLIIWVYNN